MNNNTHAMGTLTADDFIVGTRWHDGQRIRRITPAGWHVEGTSLYVTASICETVRVANEGHWTRIDTDAPGAKDGPIARITPEADEQTDGKGRTLVEIDAALEDVFEELASYARRTENLERLLAARVPKPCEPSKATGENELATAVQAADWREALVTLQFLPDGTKWLYTPDRKLFWSGGMWVGGCEDGGRAIVDDDEWIAEARRTCTDPPNLREWWPAKADDFKPTPEQQRFLASVCESCRSVVRAMLAKGDIPGVCKTGN